MRLRKELVSHLHRVRCSRRSTGASQAGDVRAKGASGANPRPYTCRTRVSTPPACMPMGGGPSGAANHLSTACGHSSAAMDT